MLMLLSPAKRLDESPKLPADLETTKPQFSAEIKQLSGVLADMNAKQIGDLMSLSDKLAKLNYDRYQSFTSADKHPALYMFQGDAYQQIDIEHYTKAERVFAAKHLRLLSGLYGVLAPFDAIQPYRLEMGTRLAGDWGKNLYDFWSDKIAKALNKAAGGEPILNLASNEYADAIDRSALTAPIIDVTFKQIKDGKAKAIGIYNKKARGMMVNWIIKNQITSLKDLKKFN